MRGRVTALVAAVTWAIAAPAWAVCPTPNTVPITLLATASVAWGAVSSAMAECSSFSADLERNIAARVQPALAATPAQVQIVEISNDSLAPLVDAGALRPLDDLVATYGQSLAPHQLIRAGGRIMAIGLTVDTTSLIYRTDILDRLGLSAPRSYDDVLRDARRIKLSGLVARPLGAEMQTGWDLGKAFLDMYLGFGGEVFTPTNAPALHNVHGIAALAMLKQITGFMDPKFLASDCAFVQAQLLQGRIAMAVLSASCAMGMDDRPSNRAVARLASAATPGAYSGGPAATTLWWDGAGIAHNSTEQQAAAAFKLIIAGIGPPMLAAHNDDAVWLMPGWRPGRLTRGAIESVQQGAPPYPASAPMRLMHETLGRTLPTYLSGKGTADEALLAVEAAYTLAARADRVSK